MALTLASAGLAGFAGAIFAPHARADGLPTVPTLPVTLPVTLPGVPTDPTGTTVTLPPSTGTTPTGGGDPAPSGGGDATTQGGSGGNTTATGSTDASGEQAAPDGAIRLTSGAVSIPVSSVHPPAKLAVAGAFSPTVLNPGRQLLRAAFRVSDSRGYVVRGAVVRVRSVPAAMFVATRGRLSATDGLVRVTLTPTHALVVSKRTSVSIVVVVDAPGKANQAGIAVSHAFKLRLARGR